MDAAFPREWATENSAAAFFQCTRWLLEENVDSPSCRYHYFCDSTYAGNYPPIVDLSVLIFAVSSYISVTAFTLVGFSSNIRIGTSGIRYLLPSGPISLPLILLILANGSRINTLFPLSAFGPALHHLVHISALAFEYDQSADKGVRYAILEASTVSGILHASLYLDSIIMPYYTGLDALTMSNYPGDCETCVFRARALVAGGGFVSYRGRSKTIMAVIATLCSRMLSRIFGEERLKLVVKVKKSLEGLSWILIATDVVYLINNVPHENDIINAMAYGGIYSLIFLNVLRKFRSSLVRIAECFKFEKRAGLCHDII